MNERILLLSRRCRIAFKVALRATRIQWLPPKQVALLILPALLTLASGCHTPIQTAALAGGVTVAGGRSPANEMEQIYYLGVFDPLDQVPPSVYRVRVHGQASAISMVHFATGWVPARLADSLGTHIGYDTNGLVQITENAPASITAAMETGRRLILFGPEGFREAPKDHRLVIVMGTDPSKYFKAMNETLGQVASFQTAKTTSQSVQGIFAELMRVGDERSQLEKLSGDFKQP